MKEQLQQIVNQATAVAEIKLSSLLQANGNAIISEFKQSIAAIANEALKIHEKTQSNEKGKI